MKVCVTGAAGNIGRSVVLHLTENGYDVKATDIHKFKKLPCRLQVADLRKLGEVFEVINECDAVIHCAANPSPTGTVPSQIFYNNFMCAYNIIQAAHVLNLQKVIIASSVTAYGVPFNQERSPQFLPVSEDHPLMPSTSYALGKKLIEEAAQDYYRWNSNLSIINLRITNVIFEDNYNEWLSSQQNLDWGSANLWSYVDHRDVAQAFRKALETKRRMCESINITAGDTRISNLDKEQIKSIFPEVKFSGDFKKGKSCISINKARNLIGYEPEISWIKSVES